MPPRSPALRHSLTLLLLASSLAGQGRLAPTAALSGSSSATTFALTATAGSLTALAADDDNLWAAGFLDNLGTPPAVARCQIATEVVFDTGIPALPGNSLLSLRLLALLYRTGQQGSGATTLPTTADSSEENAIHQARVQLLDTVTQAWSDVGSDILAGQGYTPGAPWRDTAIANAWSLASSSHPGPIDRTRTTGFVNGHVDQGQLTLRLWFDIDIDGGGWDITHQLDECWLEYDAGSGVQRLYPTAHRAWTDSVAAQVFLATGTHGNLTALQQAGETSNRFATSFFEDATALVPLPSPPVHEELWTEFVYHVAQASIPVGELGSFRFHAKMYKHGFHQGTPLAVGTTLSTVDDSSEEALIHDAEIQVRNHATGQWENVGPWLDPAQYTFDQPWRDTSYARRWSRDGSPAGPHPGPILIDQGALWRPQLLDSNGDLHLRVWQDYQFDTFGNWDIVHAFDYAWLELQPRGVVAYGHSCSPIPRQHPLMYGNGIPDAVNGNPTFWLRLEGGPPAFLAAVLMNTVRQIPPLQDPRFPGCALYPRLAGAVVLSAPSVGPSGQNQVLQPIPASPGLVGLVIEAQWFLVDPQLQLALSDPVTFTLQ